MKQTIKNSEELFKTAVEHGMKPGVTLQVFVLALLQEAYDKEDSEAIVRIHTSMLPESYHTVPAMFSRTIMQRNPYPIVQSFLRGSYLVVQAGYAKTSITFRSQAIENIRKHRIFIASKHLVPDSYLRRPSILASVLSNVTGHQVCTKCKTNKIYWYVPKQSQD
jgi:hypothetical protein